VAKKNPGAGKASASSTVRVQTHPTTHRMRKSLIAFMVVLGAHVCLYLAGASLFSTRFVPGTTVNGRNVSWYTEQELSDDIQKEATSYKDTIEAGELSLTIHGEDIGMQVDAEKAAHGAREQVNPFMWPKYLIDPPQLTVEAGTSFDEELLKQYVGAAVDEFNAGATQPQDAKLSFDGESKKYVVEPSKTGTSLNKDAVVDAALESASTHQTSAELGDEVLAQPARTKTRLSL